MKKNIDFFFNKEMIMREQTLLSFLTNDNKISKSMLALL